MLSISKYMDSHDIAQEVRMERGVHKGSFLIVEGNTDLKRFSAYIDDAECSIVNSYTRRKALGAIRLLDKWSLKGVVAVVDADFDRVNQSLKEMPNIAYSATHDFDLDWVQPHILERYLREVGDPAKCGMVGTSTEIITRIMEGLKPVSVARLWNIRGQLKFKVSGINVDDCFSGFRVNIEGYVNLLTQQERISDQEKNDLVQMLEAAAKQKFDLLQLTNGHDFHCALGACLRADLGERRSPQAWGSEVESHLRLAFSDADFQCSEIFEKLRAWEKANVPFRVIDGRFRPAEVAGF
ncbi:DUF4435 domain-containing protein [Mesorhizobium sp. M0491]|uniref:DUF4435 domain-containing protein n=1 Tax=Mesorhizobium sp. M0491 TaxID=2956950 RepID=UPI003334F890